MRILILFIIIALGVILMGNSFLRNSPNSSSGESNAILRAGGTARVADLRKLQSALELYAVENGGYPPVGELCGSVTSLKDFMVPNYLGAIPGGDLRVSVGKDGYSYVLMSKLSRTSVTLLSRDKDGSILGCNCEDPHFCLTNPETSPGMQLQ